MMRASKLGKPFQVAYVVPEMESALTHWIGTLGIGPFHIIEIDQEALVYDKPLHVRTQMALSWWNDVQIELIMPRNNAMTPYRAFLDAGRQGVHHLACVSEDFAKSDADMESAGIDRVMRGEMPGTRIAYYRTDDDFAGTMIEIVEGSPFFLDLLSRMKDACAEWDGIDAIRPIERLYA